MMPSLVVLITHRNPPSEFEVKGTSMIAIFPNTRCIFGLTDRFFQRMYAAVLSKCGPAEVGKRLF